MEFKKKEVTEVKNTVYLFECDNCKKTHEGDEMPDDWHEFEARHWEWGNDSRDSVAKYIACSPKCYFKLLKRASERFAIYKTVEIDNFYGEFVEKINKFMEEK